MAVLHLKPGSTPSQHSTNPERLDPGARGHGCASRVSRIDQSHSSLMAALGGLLLDPACMKLMRPGPAFTKTTQMTLRVAIIVLTHRPPFPSR